MSNDYLYRADLGDDALTADILRLVRARGPLSTDEIAAELAGDTGNADDLADLIDAIDDFGDHDLYTLGDRLASHAAVTADRVLTHRVTAHEIATDVIGAADVIALTSHHGTLAENGYHLLIGPDDEEIVARGVEPAADRMVLPRGTLAGVEPGTLIAARRRGDVLEFTPVADEDVRAARPAVDAVVAEAAEAGAFDFDFRFVEAMADDPGLFTTPAPPITEVAAAAGIDVVGFTAVPPGVDLESARTGSLLSEYADDLGIPEDATLGAAALVALVEFVQDGGTDDVRARFFDNPDQFLALTDPEVALRVGDTIVQSGEFDTLAVENAALLVVEHGPRRARAFARWLAGTAADAGDRAGDAERHFEGAGAYWPALRDAARIASERGDAVRAMSLLDRVPSGERGPLYDVVAEYQPVDRPGLGRNQPCWCGSGRKYKKCHLGTSAYPLTDRAAWLYRKAADTLGGPRWLSALSELVTVRVQHWEPGAESVYRAFEDGLVTDVLLFEGGAFADYLVRRGAVLPDDEKELAEAWLAVTRSVYEVVAVDSSANAVTLRDVRTDTSQEVVDVVAAAHVRAGDLICARVVPAGAHLQMPGGFEPVDAARTDALLTLLDDPAATAGDLVEFLTARFAPASAVAANGDPLVACTGTFDLTDHTIARKLGRAFGKGDHDRWTWRDDDRVRAVLRLDRAGEPWQLEVDAMDEDTFGQVLAKISEFDPGSVLRAQTRLPVSELLDDHQGAAS